MRWLKEEGKRLVRQSFAGPKDAGRQLWRVHAELERLKWWLDFYATDDTGREEILDRVDKGAAMEIDNVFLKLVPESDALFEPHIHQRCRQILGERGQPE
jgi:hypothetical protein